jgi:hypothetical protein
MNLLGYLKPSFEWSRSSNNCHNGGINGKTFFTFGRQEAVGGRAAGHGEAQSAESSGSGGFLPINGRNNVPSGEAPDGVGPRSCPRSNPIRVKNA